MKSENKSFRWIVILSAAIVVVALALVYYIRQTPAGLQAVADKTAPSAEASPTSDIQYPVKDADGRTDTQTDKSENKSDVSKTDNQASTFDDKFAEMVGRERFASLFNPENLVRNIVVEIDNATSKLQTKSDFSPIRPLESPFAVTDPQNAKETSISKENFKRYDPYIQIATSVEPRDFTTIYFRFYSEFQSVYKSVGGQKYFNDRFVEAIDHLLKTPDVDGPIRVIRSAEHYPYKYIDPELESLSATQKMLIRMGPENAQLVKAKLRQLRRLLTQWGHHQGRKR